MCTENHEREKTAFQQYSQFYNTFSIFKRCAISDTSVWPNTAHATLSELPGDDLLVHRRYSLPEVSIGGFVNALTGRGVTLVSWALVALGGLAQILHFVGGRDLWNDEAFIALNILYLSPRELLGHLDYDQVAPIGWLMVQKFLSAVGGRPEYSLRLLSLAGGLATLVVFRELAAKLNRGAGLLCAVAMMALSFPVVRYAAEIKPYGLDILFSCLIFLAGHYFLTNPRPKLWRWMGFLALGLIAPLFSFPSVYILFGVGIALFLKRLFERDWYCAAAVAAIGAFWLFGFAAVYLTLSAPQAANTVLTTGSSNDFFEANYYAPFPPRALEDIAWYANVPKKILYYLFGPAPFAIIGLMVFGTISLLGRRSWMGLSLILPVIAAVIGSGLKAYPLFDRLTLFMLPSAVLVVAAAFPFVIGNGFPRRAALILIVAAAAPSAWHLAGQLGRYPAFAFQEMRPVLTKLAVERRPGDMIYVTRRAVSAYTFYRGWAGLSDAPWIQGQSSSQWACAIPEIPTINLGSALWILVSEYNEQPWPVGGGYLQWRARGVDPHVVLEASSTNVWLYRVTFTPSGSPTVVASASPSPHCAGEPYEARRTAGRSGRPSTPGTSIVEGASSTYPPPSGVAQPPGSTSVTARDGHQTTP